MEVGLILFLIIIQQLEVVLIIVLKVLMGLLQEEQLIKLLVVVPQLEVVILTVLWVFFPQSVVVIVTQLQDSAQQLEVVMRTGQRVNPRSLVGVKVPTMGLLTFQIMLLDVLQWLLVVKVIYHQEQHHSLVVDV